MIPIGDINEALSHIQGHALQGHALGLEAGPVPVYARGLEANSDPGAMSVLQSAGRHPVRMSGEGEPEGDEEGGLAVEDAKAKPELKRPPLFKVVLLNDDYTPMEFVVEVLELFFKMNREQATQIMLTVHTQGRGVCGIYTRDIAETKSAQVNQYARDHQHPLLCEIEASED